MINLSHPTGNANVRAVLKALVKKGMLDSFTTTLASYPESFLHKLGLSSLLKDFDRRSYDTEIHPYIQDYPYPELVRLAANKFNIKTLTRHEQGTFSVDAVYRYLDKKTAQSIRHNPKALKAVYAYEDGALETFKIAKQLGLKTFYDLPIAYWETGRKLMLEEAERYPEWSSTLAGGIKDSEAKLDRKRQELELADVVIGPGSFVMDSLPDWAVSKERIVSPFGSPRVVELPPKNVPSKAPLRVLFVGSMGQRKGLADLFEAFKRLGKTKEIELVVLGSLREPLSFYKSIFPDFVYEPGRSHEGVLQLMQSCDVFCLPSIVEGRALVMQEAMSQGLPLIITSNTGGADLVETPGAGFLVPIRSPDAIAEKLNWFLTHRAQLPEMRKEAYRRSQNYTWESYGAAIAEKVNTYI